MGHSRQVRQAKLPVLFAVFERSLLLSLVGSRWYNNGIHYFKPWMQCIGLILVYSGLVARYDLALLPLWPVVRFDPAGFDHLIGEVSL